ncbi:cyclase family protein [Mycobacterium sp. SM1]|uniref:cyclase family protein n=1 Tax=Mycobacterium sp. SM1 TaxID=2816243 RepID=UPI001BD0783E|nr:cyclase family protein [Mycobacterium sp. SM1]MBS4730344.1 cyclase family protein [Mycobacterium sp. SM1]MBS4730375.1 cyclase family protein [Mycobacterium sp. SM1]
MTQLSQLPWGREDQRGATNYVTPEVTLQALQTIKAGRILELCHNVQVGHPTLEPFIPPMLMGMWSVPDTTRPLLKEHLKSDDDVGVFTERVELCMHTSTHVDALGHFTIGDEMHNGFPYRDNATNWGLKRFGIEQMPPLITRGVVADVANAAGRDYLEGGETVTVDMLERALAAQRIELQAGDVVLIRTGWGRFFMTDNDKYTASEPGIDADAARYLTAQKVCAIGADSMAVEVLPNPRGRIFPVHTHTLVEAGVHLIENVNFDNVLRENIHAFCFILLPVKFVGATASPVRAIAVV